MKSRSEPDNAFNVRPMIQQDASRLTELYNELTFGPKTARTRRVAAVMAHPGTTIFGAEADGRIIGMVTLHILPNVTYDGSPYALIENVATSQAYRMRGVGRQVMRAAIDEAWRQDVYKIMLLTGQKRSARGFYERVGFNCEDKFGMVMRRA
ncbi:GNAT family N-acetyltransferase [Roseobacter sp. YSTF-M11]|uniref:GNAT family N-acetyltransferase n=1 Tax=Roseobacter insulae TaxID=2859783 RepID=A0A9X1FW13_9RHOB|nr:GNAT family N-acetyltransferase [Roseobacter insulae]MBW4708756.1 GNAT family N-acetyltransferase [Roseobacter insulae]